MLRRKSFWFCFPEQRCFLSDPSFTPSEKTRALFPVATPFCLVTGSPVIFLTKFPEDATFQLQTFRLFLLSPSNRGSLRGSVLSSLLPTLLQPPSSYQAAHSWDHSLRQSGNNVWIVVRVQHIYRYGNKRKSKALVITRRVLGNHFLSIMGGGMGND